MSTERDSADLLARARAGDQIAIHALIEQNLAWLHARVRNRLSQGMRRDLDSGDLLHDVVAGLLQSPAGREVHDLEHFRALLLRVLEADLRDHLRWQQRERRDRRREQPIGEGSTAPFDSATKPSEHADRADRTAWIRAAMLRLSAEDQDLLRQRIWAQRSFADLAREQGVAEDAVRMRVNRSLARLAKAVAALRAGR